MSDLSVLKEHDLSLNVEIGMAWEKICINELLPQRYKNLRRRKHRIKKNVWSEEKRQYIEPDQEGTSNNEKIIIDMKKSIEAIRLDTLLYIVYLKADFLDLWLLESSSLNKEQITEILRKKFDSPFLLLDENERKVYAQKIRVFFPESVLATSSPLWDLVNQLRDASKGSTSKMNLWIIKTFVPFIEHLEKLGFNVSKLKETFQDIYSEKAGAYCIISAFYTIWQNHNQQPFTKEKIQELLGTSHWTTSVYIKYLVRYNILLEVLGKESSYTLSINRDLFNYNVRLSEEELLDLFRVDNISITKASKLIEKMPVFLGYYYQFIRNKEGISPFEFAEISYIDLAHARIILERFNKEDLLLRIYNFTGDRYFLPKYRPKNSFTKEEILDLMRKDGHSLFAEKLEKGEKHGTRTLIGLYPLIRDKKGLTGEELSNLLSQEKNVYLSKILKQYVDEKILFAVVKGQSYYYYASRCVEDLQNIRITKPDLLELLREDGLAEIAEKAEKGLIPTINLEKCYLAIRKYQKHGITRSILTKEMNMMDNTSGKYHLDRLYTQGIVIKLKCKSEYRYYLATPENLQKFANKDIRIVKENIQKELKEDGFCEFLTYVDQSTHYFLLYYSLVRNKVNGYTKEEFARAVDIHPTNAYTILDKFYKIGILVRIKEGKKYRFIHKRFRQTLLSNLKEDGFSELLNYVDKSAFYILRYYSLVREKINGYTKEEFARAADIHPPHAYTILDKFHKIGILVRIKEGKKYRFIHKRFR